MRMFNFTTTENTEEAAQAPKNEEAQVTPTEEILNASDVRLPNRKETGIGLILAVLLLGGTILLFPPQKQEPEPEVSIEVAVPPNPFEGVVLRAKSAIVLDLATDLPLYEKNAETQLPLASLTKLLTTYAATDSMLLATPVTVTAKALNQEGDSGLEEGEVFIFSDIAQLALVASSNDAAAAIIEAAGKQRSLGDRDLLESAAAAAGLSQTYALNGTGLDETDSLSGGYGSARDVAILAGALLRKAPELAEATTKETITVRSENGISHTVKNTDVLVTRFPNLLLSKTGYTDLAGGNLVVVFDAGINHPVAIAVLGSTREERFTDVDTLISLTLAHFAGLASSSLTYAR
ncbi:MAG: serine hydrolase [Minisyncoccia bacterium]